MTQGLGWCIGDGDRGSGAKGSVEGVGGGGKKRMGGGEGLGRGGRRRE